MAFTIEGEKQNKMAMRVIIIVILVMLLVFATYYLFFTKPPQIEVLVPVELETISQISDLEVNPSAIIESPEYQSLKEHVAPPELGEFGRVNPFANF